MRTIKLFLFISLFTFFINSSVFAQQTGSLSGQVFDTLGAIIVGATVTAVDANQKEKTATTNNQGVFTIGGLAPGTYTVRAIAPNFGLYENTEVVIKAGGREELTIALAVQAVSAQVEVATGAQVNTEPDNNASATVLKDKDLEALPDDPDELEAALQALAGPSAGPNGGQIYIDGFTGGRLPPKESIREIRINQNPFSAEFERLGFGRIEILTKPGSDKFRGQAFFNFNDESLNSRNPFALNRAPSQTRFFGGSLSGPVKKGKSSFFVDVSNRNVDNNTVVNATVLDSSFNIVPFQQDVTLPSSRFSISPRFDYQINTNNTLVARYGFTRIKALNFNGGFSLPSLASNGSSTEHEFRLTETAILNPKTINETRFQYEINRRNQTGDNSIPTINVSGAFVGGGSQIGTNFNNNNSFELQNYTTTSLGKTSQHSIKFGGRLRGVKIKDQSESNFGGTFTFTGVPEVRLNSTCKAEETGCIISPAISSIEQYRQKLLGNTDPRFNPNQFIITSGNPLADVSQYDVGLFVTDDWKMRPDLTLSFGLRYENQTNISDNMNFAPRFSFAYSPGAKGAKQPKTVFRGGAGIFFDRFGENFTLQSERFNGTNQTQYIVGNNPAILTQPVFSLSGVTNAPTVEQIANVAPGTFTVRRVDANLHSPTTYQYALSIERQLPLKIRGALYFVGSRTIHQLRTRNINAPVCGFVSICSSLTSPQIQLLRPDPAQGNIYEYEANGVSNQQQLIFNASSQLSRKVTLNANYRFGLAKSNTDGGNSGGNFPAYSYDFSGEYGNSIQDIRHFFSMYGSFQLPWKVRMSPIIIARSGVPFNIVTGVDTNRDSQFTERPTFAQLNSACVQRGLTNSFCDISGISNTAAVIPRNYGRGPSFFSVNLNFTKTVGFGKSRAQVARRTDRQAPSSAGEGANRPNNNDGGGRGGRPNAGLGGEGRREGGGGFGGGAFGGASDKPYNLTFGLQISNLFNRANFNAPVGNLNSNRFGQFTSIVGGGFGGFGGFGGNGAANRRVDLTMRFSF
ncbi:MAG: carboxypeptidase regulatory-like domain-containing protein [Acidobacteriota bacterium]|nr:carboxypeptidase regulatory-like domain-containing protein [Acidobacteriota bacterium]